MAGRKRAAREFAKLVKSEVKSIQNMKPPAISALLLNGEGETFWTNLDWKISVKAIILLK